MSDLPKLKTITVVCVDLGEGRRIEGDSKSVIFYNDNTEECGEFTWKELFELAMEV